MNTYNQKIAYINKIKSARINNQEAREKIAKWFFGDAGARVETLYTSESTLLITTCVFLGGTLYFIRLFRMDDGAAWSLSQDEKFRVSELGCLEPNGVDYYMENES